jgi:hypothetical protein
MAPLMMHFDLAQTLGNNGGGGKQQQLLQLQQQWNPQKRSKSDLFPKTISCTSQNPLGCYLVLFPVL